MSIRSKTVTRLLIILAVLVLLGGGLTTWTLIAASNREKEIARSREDGIAAAKAGDHVKALNLLSRYLRYHKDDAEALYEYAVARREIPAPQGKHILEALSLFRAVLELDPNHTKAQKDLLQIYSIIRYNTEALDLADKILAKTPDDAEVLRYKAFAQIQLRKFDLALTTVSKAVEVDADNIQGQMMVLEIMRQLDKPAAEVVGYAQGLLDKKPDDARTEMLLGYANFLTRQYDKAREWLLKAIERDAPNPEFVRVLSLQLDQLAMFRESIELLKKNVEKSGDPLLARLLVRRYWELFRYDEMLAQLDKLDLTAPKSHSELMAFKAMALIRTGHIDDAKAVMELMIKRGDAPARAWVAVLREVVLPQTQDVKKVIEVCQTALTADPANPYIRFFLGEAFFQIGENELALEQWKTSVSPDRGGSATWALPWVRISQAFAATGRARLGLEAAANAVRRAPTNSAAISALATAQSTLLEETGLAKEKNKELLELLTQIQRASPGEAQTLPLYVELLAKEDRLDEAAMTILDAIAGGGQFPQYNYDQDAAFKDLDKDDDKMLSRDEYQKALSGEYLKAAERRFAAADANHDGKVSRDEFHALNPGDSDNVPATAVGPDGKKPESALGAHFKAADKNADGDVTLDEWLVELRDGEFRRADGNIDGKLSPDEFKAGADPESLLVRLAAISSDKKLGLEEACYSASEKRWGMSPNLAYARAVVMCIEKSKEEGRAYFTKLYEEGDHKKELTWETAYAQMLTYLEDKAAGELWIKLADANADNMAIQRRALGSPSVQDNRQFLDRVIERVRSLGGEAGLTWKLARARWWLNSEDGTRDASKAVALLNDVVRASPDLMEPRLLLAAALQKVDNVSGAVDQLTAAYNLQPKNLSITLALARLRLAQGDYVQTHRLLDQVMKDSGVNEVQMRQVAAMQAQMGDLDDAVKLLAGAGKSDEPDLMLAELYFRTNDRPKAEAIYKKLMDKPTVQVVQSYSTFLGTAERIDEANSVLKHLDTMTLNPGVGEMVRAEFNRRFVSMEAAVREYENAVKAVPVSQVPYLNLMSLYLERGKVDEALAINSRAVKAQSTAKVFTLIEANSELLKSVATKPQLQRLVQSVLSDNDHREPAIEVLRIIDKAARDKDPVLPTLARLRQQAEKYPKFLPLQILMVDLYAGAGRLEDAGSVASRAMQTFPNNPEPAEQATRVMAAMRRWSEVLTMAAQWRERSLTRPLAADIAMAEAYINTGESKKALDQVAHYRTAALADPNNFFGVISVNVRALALAGRYDEAATLLKPLLTGPQGWRDFWQVVAMTAIRDPKIEAAWLDRVQPVIPPDAQEELQSLANNWYTLGKRNNSPEYKNKGLDMIRALAKREDALPGPMIGYAILAYQEGDLATAEAQYRLALTKRPDHTVALNNMAMLIVEKNGDLDEALRMAKVCVEKEPNNANFYDTMASVQSKRKEYAAAVESLRQALQIQPSNIEWRLSMAQAQIDQGKTQEAQDIVKEIETLQPRIDTLPQDQQKRLRDIKAVLTEKAVAVP